MATSGLVNRSGLIDAAKRFALVRQHRWPEGACCPVCGSGAVIRDGHDDAQPCRQRHRCKTCSGRFDDLTGLDAVSRHLPLGDRYAMVLAGYHQPLRVWVWVLCLPFMGLNLSNRQIALELGLDSSDAQAMTEQLRRRLAGAPGRGRLQKDKPPILGLIQRGKPSVAAKSCCACLPTCGRPR